VKQYTRRQRRVARRSVRQRVRAGLDPQVVYLAAAHKHHHKALQYIWKELKTLGAPIAKALHKKALSATNTIAKAIDDIGTVSSMVGGGIGGELPDI